MLPEDLNLPIVICGDLFDRGKEAEELQKYILDLMDRDEGILIRGNHEDLFFILRAGNHHTGCLHWLNTIM
jgi:metallophosphoesterase superfamily enzyme